MIGLIFKKSAIFNFLPNVGLAITTDGHEWARIKLMIEPCLQKKRTGGRSGLAAR
jgi:hypothetical protein